MVAVGVAVSVGGGAWLVGSGVRVLVGWGVTLGMVVVVGVGR